MKRTELFWPVLVSTYLLGSLAVSHYALFGSWMQSAFGVPHYYNWDPDGYYLAAGIMFFDGPFAAWYGHPGLPLQFMIGTIAKGMHALSGDWNHLAYPVFVAQNQYEIILATKVAMTICHLVSFYFLFKLARMLLEEWESKIAVILFATTAITLTYINKISPEPFLLLFVLAGSYFSIRAVAHADTTRACGLICIAGISAALAMLTKLTVTFLLPVHYLLWILIYPRIHARRKVALAACFIVSCLAGLFLVGRKINWGDFFSFWSAWSPIGFDALTGETDELSNPLTSIAKIISIISKTAILYLDAGTLFPPKNHQSQLILTELPLIVAGFVSILFLLKTRMEKRWVVYSLILIMLILAPVVIWKNASHYRFIHLAILSIFVAFGLGEIARRCRAGTGEIRRRLILAVCLLSLSGPGIALAISKTVNDMESYNKGWNSIYACLRNDRNGRMVTLVNNTNKAFLPGRLLGWYFDFLNPNNLYSRALETHFLYFSALSLRQDAADSECVIDVDKLY
jgi:hypothetical protein